MRAVADNPTLAGVKGINADAVARLVNFVGMGLAGVGGMLLGLDTSIDPLTGFRVILSVFAAAVVGGLGSIPGAVVGALTIGVAEELSLLSLAPAYRTAVGLRRHPGRAHPAPSRHSRRARVLGDGELPRSPWPSRGDLCPPRARAQSRSGGMTGMINLGLVGFFAVGAYVSALATKKLGVPIAVGLVGAMVVAAAAGTIVALVTARLRGDYLAIITLGFSEVVRIVASNEIWLTNGTDGISGIPGPCRGRVTPEQFNLMYLAIVVGGRRRRWWLVLERVRRSPYGRVLRAIRDDEQVAEVAGKPVLAFKVEAFAVSAAVLGLAGGLYGALHVLHRARRLRAARHHLRRARADRGRHRQQLGRRARRRLVVFFLESTRFATAWLPGLKPVQVAAVREFVIGASLILVLRFRPGRPPAGAHCRACPCATPESR